MKTYQKVMAEHEVLDVMSCNKCTRVINIEKEDAFEAEVAWGYDSRWDGFAHSFELCQECYERFIDAFITPVCVGKIEESGDIIDLSEGI